MKKLLTVAFLAVSMLFVASSANAQSWKKNSQNKRVKPVKRYDPHQNKPIVRTYYQTQNVWHRNQQFRETYKITVFRNGRTNKQLVSRVQIKNHRQKGLQNTHFQTKTIWQRGKKYRATYKVTNFRNGRKKVKLVKMVRIR